MEISMLQAPTRPRLLLAVGTLLVACAGQPGDAVAPILSQAGGLTAAAQPFCRTPPPDKRQSISKIAIAGTSVPEKVSPSVKKSAKGVPGKRDDAPPPAMFAITDDHRAKRSEFLVKLAALKAKTTDPVKFDNDAAALKKKELAE